MVGWHHRLNVHESEQTPEDSEEQRNLECCCPWGHRVRNDFVTEQKNLEKLPDKNICAKHSTSTQ